MQGGSAHVRVLERAPLYLEAAAVIGASSSAKREPNHRLRAGLQGGAALIVFLERGPLYLVAVARRASRRPR